MHFSLFILFISFLCELAIAARALGGHPILEPVSDDCWSNSFRRRSTKDSLKLLDYEHLVWNSPQNSTQNIYVNMTLFTADEELVISMERFAHQLKAVNCSQDMVMAFKSNSSYQTAIKSWDWVNFNQQRTFIMIANYPGCGTGRSRQPWVVSNVDYDPQHLIVHLNATKKDWKEVAHTYNLDFGQYSPATFSKLRRWGIDDQINLDLTATIPATFTTSVTLDGALNVDVSCTNCGTKGTLTLAGHVEMSWFSFQQFTITARPIGIGLDLNLDMSISAASPGLSFNPAPWEFLTIPLGGFEIPGLVNLGPALTLGAGFGITGVQGAAKIAASVTGKIPDDSLAEIQLAGDRRSTVSGWVPQWSTGPMDVSNQITSSIDVFGSAKVGVALEVVGTGFEIAFNLKIPDVSLTTSLTHDSSGVCADKQHVDGVSLALAVGADLSFQGNVDVLGTQTTFLSYPVFSEQNAFEPPPLCFGFGPLVRS